MSGDFGRLLGKVPFEIQNLEEGHIDEEEEGQERLRALRMLIKWTLRGKQANRVPKPEGR